MKTSSNFVLCAKQWFRKMLVSSYFKSVLHNTTLLNNYFCLLYRLTKVQSFSTIIHDKIYIYYMPTRTSCFGMFYTGLTTTCFCCRKPVRTSRETFVERAVVVIQHAGAARRQWERASRSEIWHHAAADHRCGKLFLSYFQRH